MKHHKSHLVLCIFALLITLFVYGLYWYMYSRVNASVTHALSAKDEVRKAQLNKDEGKTVAKTYEDTAADRARLNTFFVTDNDKISFIEMIEALGKDTKSEVTLTSISADDLTSSPDGTEGTITIHLDVEGTWSSVLGTLILAENLPYKVTVKDVHVSTSGTTSGKDPKPLWRLTFVLSASSIHSSQ